MSFPRYPKYKPSGVEWIGDVPEHWDVHRLKALFELQNRMPLEGDGIVTAFRDGQVTLRSNRRTEGFTNAVQEAGYQRVLKGDLVIHAMDAFAGAIGVSDSDGKSTPVYSVCTPRHPWVHVPYFGRLLRHMALSGYITALAKGIRERSTEFRWNEASNVRLAVPGAREQEAIAAFLDRETAKIDALVAEQDRLIESLKEKRQAVISHAVTRGLNPDVPMKDSGVEWLGEVPVHWSLRKLRSVTRFLTSGPRGWSDRVGETGALFIQSGDLDDEMGIDFGTAKRVSVEHDAETARTRLQDGDVVVCITGAKTGNVAVCATVPEEAYVNQHVCLVRPTSEVLPRFLAAQLKGRVGQTHFDLSQYGLKQGLSLDDVKEAPVLLPPLSEQAQIVASVDAAAGRIDVLATEALRAVVLLQERRTALISAVVTGQIDVRPESMRTAA